MNITESKKKYNDSDVDLYLENHDVYSSSDLCIDIAAVIQYARDNGIALSSVPQNVIEQHTKKPAQKVG